MHEVLNAGFPVLNLCTIFEWYAFLIRKKEKENKKTLQWVLLNFTERTIFSHPKRKNWFKKKKIISRIGFGLELWWIYIFF